MSATLTAKRPGPDSLEYHCERPYVPAEPHEPGYLWIDSTLYEYHARGMDWTLRNCVNDAVYTVRGRLVLLSCSCDDYRYRRAKTDTCCKHMLALLRCQRYLELPTADGPYPFLIITLAKESEV